METVTESMPHPEPEDAADEFLMSIAQDEPSSWRTMRSVLPTLPGAGSGRMGMARTFEGDAFRLSGLGGIYGSAEFAGD